VPVLVAEGAQFELAAHGGELVVEGAAPGRNWRALPGGASAARALAPVVGDGAGVVDVDGVDEALVVRREAAKFVPSAWWCARASGSARWRAGDNGIEGSV
jgi:hypothetical protein